MQIAATDFNRVAAARLQGALVRVVSGIRIDWFVVGIEINGTYMQGLVQIHDKVGKH
jgi:hypothetical protein